LLVSWILLYLFLNVALKIVKAMSSLDYWALREKRLRGSPKIVGLPAAHPRRLPASLVYATMLFEDREACPNKYY